MKLNYKPVSGCSSHRKAVEAPQWGTTGRQILNSGGRNEPSSAHTDSVCIVFHLRFFWRSDFGLWTFLCLCGFVCSGTHRRKQQAAGPLATETVLGCECLTYTGAGDQVSSHPQAISPELLAALHPSKVPKNTLKQKWKQGVPSISHLIVSNPWVIQTHY